MQVVVIYRNSFLKKEKFMMKTILNRVIAILLIALTITSCAVPATAGPGKPNSSVLSSTTARAIDDCLNEYRDLLEDEFGGELESLGTLSGEEVVRRTLEEENGERYVSFCYLTCTEGFSTTDDVFSAAEGLISDDEMKKLKEDSQDIERRLFELYEPEMRRLSAAQQEAFAKDLRKLVVKAVVLLTASVVYAVIPNSVFWGKLSAAIALATAAGITASTLLNIIEYYKAEKKSNSKLTMTEWLKEVTTEPAQSAALATGIIATGTAVSRTPFATSVILAIFALVGIVDDFKAMLSTYNITI